MVAPKVAAAVQPTSAVAQLTQQAVKHLTDYQTNVYQNYQNAYGTALRTLNAPQGGQSYTMANLNMSNTRP